MKRKSSSSSSSSVKKTSTELSKIKQYFKVGDRCVYHNGRNMVIGILDRKVPILVLQKHSTRSLSNKRIMYVEVDMCCGKVYNRNKEKTDRFELQRDAMDDMVVGSSVMYNDRFHTYFICVICSVDSDTLTIQPFGIARYIYVNRKSPLLYKCTNKIVDFSELTVRVPQPNALLFSTLSCSEGNWRGLVVEHNPIFNLYLVRRYGSNPSYGETADVGNYHWTTAETIASKCTKETRALELGMNYNIPLGSVTIQRREQPLWDLWKHMFSIGEEFPILEDLYQMSRTGSEWLTQFGTDSDMLAFTEALTMSTNKTYACIKPHFSPRQIQYDYGFVSDFTNIIRNVERQKMQLSFNGTRNDCNMHMAQYFSHMNPDNFETYIHNQRNILSSYASSKVTCKIDSVTDHEMKITILYHGEPHRMLVGTVKRGRQNHLMKRMFFALKKTDMNSITRLIPSQYTQLDKWYNKDIVYTGSPLPLFHYQKMVVMQMISREENETSAVSHCLEKVHNSVQYNLLTGSHCKDIFPCTGGILSMDVGLGKTVCILALYHYSKVKTLVVCPLTLIDQWKNEINKFLPGEHVTEYHGKRKNMEGNIVLTTYGTLRSAYNKNVFFNLFDRVVFDESHTVVNPHSGTALACCSVMAKYRWCVTATPITKNSFSTLAGQLSILRVSPFDGFGTVPFSQDSFNRDPRYYSDIFQTIWNGLFFGQKREEMDKRGIVYDKQRVLQVMEYVNDPLVEYRVLYNILKQKVSECASHPTFSQMTMYKNLMLMGSTHPCLVPMWYYAERCILDGINSKTADQLANDIGNSNYETELKKTLTNLDDESCVICMEPLTRPTITKCNHIFCYSCIQQQISHRANCPMCRTSITTDSLVEITVDETDVEENDTEVTFCNTIGHKYKIKREHYDMYNKRKEDMLDSPKMKQLKQIVDNTKESVIIFSRLNSVLLLLKQQFPDAEIIMGTKTRAQRKRAIENFQNKTSKVFILSMKCASIGLTLTTGSHLVFMEPCIDDEVHKQAIGRLSRTGQLNDVTVHTMVTKRSFDERILELKSGYDKYIEEYKDKIAGNRFARNKKIFQTESLIRLFC